MNPTNDPQPDLSVMRPAEAGAVVKADAVTSVALMLQAVIQQGVKSENVAALEKLVGLYERMQDRDAQKLFAVALVKLQSDVKNVQAVRPVTIGGTVRYHFAPYEDLMIEVAPHLARNGFSISYSTAFTADRIVKTLKLTHCGGHSQTNDYAVKVSKPITNSSGKDVVSEAQMESMAGTTAKRGALCDALNIVVEKYEQDDPRMAGHAISVEEATSLMNRLRALQLTPAKDTAFMKWAGAETVGQPMVEDFQRIQTPALPKIEAWLTEQEAKKK